MGSVFVLYGQKIDTPFKPRIWIIENTCLTPAIRHNRARQLCQTIFKNLLFIHTAYPISYLGVNYRLSIFTFTDTG